MEEMRLQRALALRGVASRRKAEELIQAGRVKVNDVVITTLGTKVTDKDVIKVDNKEVTKVLKAYYLLNKPVNYLTTLSDPFNRRTIVDLFSPQMKLERVFPIGRLDYETSGALLLTNDGDLAYKLTKTSNNIPKVYQVRVFGILTQDMITKLLKGVLLDGILAKIKSITDIVIEKKINQSSFIITIEEAKNRQVRRMLESLKLEIKWIKRLSFADINISGLKEGEIRPLKPHEIKKLHVL